MDQNVDAHQKPTKLQVNSHSSLSGNFSNLVASELLYSSSHFWPQKRPYQYGNLAHFLGNDKRFVNYAVLRETNLEEYYESPTKLDQAFLLQKWPDRSAEPFKGSLLRK